MAIRTPQSGTAPSGLRSNDLIASYYTLSGAPVGHPARFSLEARVAAAAAVGFTAIGLAVEDYQACRERGLTPATLRQILADSGVVVAELEFLTNWWRDDAVGKQARLIEDQLYAAAEVFGARHMNVGCIGGPGTLPTLTVVAEQFAAAWAARSARIPSLVRYS